ncbi:MAG: ABC transporter permease subunit [Brachymonas sp.]
MGADHLGRDVFARLAEGGWRAMSAALSAAALALTGGLLLGLLSALAPHSAGFLAMRLADLLALVPEIVIAILVVAVLGPSVFSIALGLGIAATGSAALLVHGLTQQAQREGYVISARALGASKLHVARWHLLPAVLPPLLTYIAGHVGHLALGYSALAFLGLGADSGAPDWGSMMFEYRAYWFEDPMLVILPGMALLLFSAGMNLLIEPQRNTTLWK